MGSIWEPGRRNAPPWRAPTWRACWLPAQYFQIGNEPEYYKDANNGLRAADWNFDKYLAQWSAMARAVLERAPDARLGGPDVGSNAQWVERFAQEAPKLFPGRIVAATGHYYAEGPPDNPRVTVARLLAGDPRVDRDLKQIVAATDSAGIHYRMTEGNSCYRGGKPGMSNAFCSALWAADYMLKLAEYGSVGVNLHGGGSNRLRPRWVDICRASRSIRRPRLWLSKAASIRPSPAAGSPGLRRGRFFMA